MITIRWAATMLLAMIFFLWWLGYRGWGLWIIAAVLITVVFATYAPITRIRARLRKAWVLDGDEDHPDGVLRADRCIREDERK